MKIRRLTLYCEDLNAQKVFYRDRMGMTPVEDSPDAVSFQTGDSLLSFRQEDGATPYHFAFNIPSFVEKEALGWLKARVDILDDGGQEIQDFRSWNAKSIYFYDAAGNIVEFISRRNLGYEATGNFSAASIRELSEIGLAVTEIKPCYEKLRQLAGLEIYDGGFDSFCALGDEYGLIICIDKDAKTWYPSGDQAFASAFRMEFLAEGKPLILEYSRGELEISGPYEPKA